MRWSVVVPVKRLPAAKTRLFADGSVRFDRTRLVLALAQDTVLAAMATPAVDRVVVVSDDADAARALAAIGATVVPDRPDAGLNPAVEYGAEHARAMQPADGVAVLAGDLAALRPAELDSALAMATAGRSFITDNDLVGTTMLAAAPGIALDPRYGNGSRAAHLQTGAVELHGEWPSLRCDVDTPAALRRAAGLGLGPHTRALLEPL